MLKYTTGLARNVASPASTSATAFACRLVNSTQELVKEELKRDRQEEIMHPNS